MDYLFFCFYNRKNTFISKVIFLEDYVQSYFVSSSNEFGTTNWGKNSKFLYILQVLLSFLQCLSIGAVILYTQLNATKWMHLIKSTHMNPPTWMHPIEFTEASAS